nr:Protein ovarian tumor locus like [Ipomoea batatas]
MEITRPRPRPPKDLICRKHPKNAAQSPGVCSVCLMEKLSQLYTATVSGSNTTTMASSCSSSSLSPLSSSSDVSSCSSPSRRRVQDISGLMMKSRSVAFITRRRRVEDDGKGKTAGFWSKLLRRKKNRVNERLMHSKTTRERVAVV